LKKSAGWVHIIYGMFYLASYSSHIWDFSEVYI